MLSGTALLTPAPRLRSRPLVALYEDDPWLASGRASPLSAESIDVLFRFGPVAYGSRCFDSSEYNASVRKIMARYPRISRELAEQEVHAYIFSATDYLAKQTAERKRRGPSEDELEPPLDLPTKLLAVAWVCVLIPSASFIVSQIPK